MNSCLASAWSRPVRHLNVRPPAHLAFLASCAAVGCLTLATFSSVARAHDVKPAEQPPCSCPNSTAPGSGKPPAVVTKPKFAETNAHLDENDEIAALEAIR